MLFSFFWCGRTLNIKCWQNVVLSSTFIISWCSHNTYKIDCWQCVLSTELVMYASFWIFDTTIMPSPISYRPPTRSQPFTSTHCAFWHSNLQFHVCNEPWKHQPSQILAWSRQKYRHETCSFSKSLICAESMNVSFPTSSLSSFQWVLVRHYHVLATAINNLAA